MSHTVPAFVAIHSTYSTVSVGFFIGTACVSSITADHKKACTLLLGNLEQLLAAQKTTLQDLKFIAVNQGPGPYTTLRITLAMADGLGFATGIPLVGVDGFAAFVAEVNEKNSDKTYDYTVILLNAFCREVFYAIHDNSKKTMATGYLPIDELVERLNALGNKKIVLAGNGATLFAPELAMVTVPTITIVTPFQETPSLTAIGQMAYKNWESGSGVSSHLLPLYLKRPVYRTIAEAPSQP